MADYEGVSAETALLATMERHRAFVRLALQGIAHDLERRALVHDLSKFTSEELPGFVQINQTARNHPYGSEEYRASIRAVEAPAIHQRRNSHHPESAETAEEWKDVDGCPGYQVSNLGQVRSIDRVVKREGDKGDISRSGAMMSHHKTPKGYIRVQLRVDGKPSNRLVHVLVATAFIGKPKDDDDGRQVNHVNGKKDDNRAWNLEWCTPSENLQHAYDSGLRVSNATHIYICNDLGIATIGAAKMEEEVRARGYENVSASGIWGAANRDGGSHQGLSFTSAPIYAPDQDPGNIGMGWLDIVEMVADWWSASQTYGNTPWSGVLEIQRKRWAWTDAQWWLIEQVADWVSLIPGAK